MARSASKGIFPRTGIVDGHIITHPNGKRYQWNSSKGVWKLKSTMIDDSNFIGPQGIQGPPGPAIASLTSNSSGGVDFNPVGYNFEINSDNVERTIFAFNDTGVRKWNINLNEDGGNNLLINGSTQFKVNAGSILLNASNVELTSSIKIGDDTRTAATAGPGTIRWNGTNVQFSTGGVWEDINTTIVPPIVNDGSTAALAFDTLDSIDGLYASGDYSLYTTVHGSTTAFTAWVNFDGAKPRYKATRIGGNAGSYTPNNVAGICVGATGNVGGCDEGTGANFTLYKAMVACIKAGARLCTRDDIKAGAAQGSGCSHDHNAIWSSTSDGAGNYWRVQGNQYSTNTREDTASPTNTTLTGYDDNKIGFRCCNANSGSAQYWQLGD
jgi:hypothetical protein